ncbi:MAG: formate--tetrahydrofolate ligase [Oscillospiraceae bacterium]|nr:formate--tetrahydrofolate ligase [Oscillospiraceae bacterium]
MLTDIEIAKKIKLENIQKIVEKLNIDEEYIHQYGKYKAKIDNKIFKKLKNKENGKLILVTSINPTPTGEGKTTMSIGLALALNKLNKNAILALREPSLGPVFGIKGGATGGGYSQVLPMEDINLHFNGDFHAITSANNLLAAVIDNHIFQGNELDIQKITFNRCLDMNDRALRNVKIKTGKNTYRDEKFNITVASEIMAVFCLSENLIDLKNRLGNIVVGYNSKDEEVFVKDLNVQGAMAALLKDAINPNLVQTTEHTPCLIHGGPFANIAHGCNSIIATKMALKLGDYCVTEAGFGSDLGAEKFMDIKCRKAELKPNCVVLVATIKALKYNGGCKNLKQEDVEALKRGVVNLEKHIENVKSFGVPMIVCINKFEADTKSEIDVIVEICKKYEVEYSLSTAHLEGSAGSVDLAQKVTQLCEKPTNFKFLYDESLTPKEKIETIAKNIYGADGVTYLPSAEEKLAKIKNSNYPICVAKTPVSLTDNKDILGRPTGFTITVTDIRVNNGAEFIVVLCGDVMTMPGLPKESLATKIDVDDEGNILGMI